MSEKRTDKTAVKKSLTDKTKVKIETDEQQ